MKKQMLTKSQGFKHDLKKISAIKPYKFFFQVAKLHLFFQ